MNSTNDPPEPRGAKRAIAAAIQHSNTWGPVWFGLIFIGSVLNAVGSDMWPNVPSLTLAAISGAVGLSAGVIAKQRGVWL